MKIFPCNLRHWIIILFISSLALPPYAAAQQPSDDDDYQGTVNPSMAVIVIVLVCAFFITGCFSIFIQQCSSSSSYGVSIAGVVASAGGRSRRGNKRGVDRSVIDTFPTFDYAAVMEKKIGKGALECAVCLSEFEKEDTLRLLPKCDHVFHADCIDAWLVNHATCPVCRANLIPDSDELAKPNESIQINEEQHESASSDSIPRSRSEHSVRIAIESDQTAIVIPKLPRSHSTGHSLIQPGVDCERFKLRLPEEVRKQIMSRAKLNRTRSLVNLPRVSSSRRGYRNGCGGEGSGSSRYRRLFGRSGRWPSFIARNVSFKSPKGDAAAGSDSKKYLTAVVAPLERLGVKEGTTSSQTVLPV